MRNGYIYLFLTSNEYFVFWKYNYIIILQIIEQIFKNIFL